MRRHIVGDAAVGEGVTVLIEHDRHTCRHDTEALHPVHIDTHSHLVAVIDLEVTAFAGKERATEDTKQTESTETADAILHAECFSLHSLHLPPPFLKRLGRSQTKETLSFVGPA